MNQIDRSEGELINIVTVRIAKNTLVDATVPCARYKFSCFFGDILVSL